MFATLRQAWGGTVIWIVTSAEQNVARVGVLRKGHYRTAKSTAAFVGKAAVAAAEILRRSGRQDAKAEVPAGLARPKPLASHGCPAWRQQPRIW